MPAARIKRAKSLTQRLFLVGLVNEVRRFAAAAVISRRVRLSGQAPTLPS